MVAALHPLASLASRASPLLRRGRTMSAELRQALRLAIDRAVRARIDWQAEPRCSGCGGELFDEDGQPEYIAGCRLCTDRRCKHRLRARDETQLVLEEAVA